MTQSAAIKSERTPSALESVLIAHGRTASEGSRAALGHLKKDALSALLRQGLPERKSEAFRFSHLGKAVDEAARVFHGGSSHGLQGLVHNGIELRLVNGVAQDVGTLPQGLSVFSIRSAGDAQLGLMGSLLSEQDGWIAANTAGFEDGYVIVVEPGAQISQVVTVDLLQTADTAGTVSLPRVLVILGKGSQLTLVERHGSSGTLSSLSSTVCEIFVGESAVLSHVRWVELGEQVKSLAATGVAVDEGATYQSFSASARGSYVRHDLQVRLRGERATAVLDGLYYGRDGQLVDQHVRVFHEAREGTTKECYRGVIEERGRGVFDGIIYVGKGAVKTDARQENRNLLLGPNAVVNTKPHLEIDCDDVSCSHGATVGQLDENQLFYLQARGIGEEVARQMLTWAFAKELVDRCPVAEVRELAARSLRGELLDGSENGGKP